MLARPKFENLQSKYSKVEPSEPSQNKKSAQNHQAETTPDETKNKSYNPNPFTSKEKKTDRQTASLLPPKRESFKTRPLALYTYVLCMGSFIHLPFFDTRKHGVRNTGNDTRQRPSPLFVTFSRSTHGAIKMQTETAIIDHRSLPKEHPASLPCMYACMHE